MGFDQYHEPMKNLFISEWILNFYYGARRFGAIRQREEYALQEGRFDRTCRKS